MNTHLPIWPFLQRAEIIEIEDCQISSWCCCDAKRGIWEFKTSETVLGKGFGPWHLRAESMVVQVADNGSCKVNLELWDSEHECWYTSDKLITVRFLMTRPLTVDEVYKAA
jgi:hypothetical protein